MKLKLWVINRGGSPGGCNDMERTQEDYYVYSEILGGLTTPSLL